MSYTRQNPVDRVPTKAGRVLITPENGSTPYYAVVTLADEPTVIGTKINAVLFDTIEDELESLDDGLTTVETEKAPLTSPNLSGTPTTPTAAFGTATTQIASTAFVGNAMLPVYPQARATATYSESLAASTSVTKTIALSSTNPRRLLLYFKNGQGGYTAQIEGLKNSSGNYVFHMSGWGLYGGVGDLGGAWTRDYMYNSDLFGSCSSSSYSSSGVLGSSSLGSATLAITNVTVSGSSVSFTVKNYDSSNAVTITTSVAVEVF